MMNKDSFNFEGIKFCLVFPPYQESEDLVFLKTAKRNLGKIPPLSLCAVAAVLEKYGAKVKIIDANALSLSLDEAIKEIVDFSPEFLGFTLATYQFHFTLEWIRKIRSKVNLPVIVGGPHARIYPREILTHRCIDYCVTGDAEGSLAQLVHSLTEGLPLLDIPGIAYREDGDKVKVNSVPMHIKDLDSISFPSRHLVNNALYYSLISRHKNFTAMTSSRGCIFGCTFCDNQCIPYRKMSPGRIVDEMEACKKEFNINEIDMFDGIFSVSKDRLSDICIEIKKRGLKVYWSFRTRADLIDGELAKKLKDSGCVRIYYGIESGSARILKNIKKNEDLECIKDAVRLTKNAGIETFGYFMVGNPGEDASTIEETMRLMLSLPLDYVQIAPIFYPPGTEIYSGLMNTINQDYWKEYTINPDYRIEFPVVGTDFNKAQIHSLARKMYLRFYLRPQFIIKFLLRLNSFSNLNKSRGAFFDMMKEAITRNERIKVGTKYLS